MVILSLKVVLRAGLEPTTLCLEGRCSIQLSYRSKNTKLMLAMETLLVAHEASPGCHA